MNNLADRALIEFKKQLAEKEELLPKLSDPIQIAMTEEAIKKLKILIQTAVVGYRNP